MTSKPRNTGRRRKAAPDAGVPAPVQPETDETTAAPLAEIAESAAVSAEATQSPGTGATAPEPPAAETTAAEAPADVATGEVFAETHGYSPQTYGKPKTDAFHSVAATLESKKQRQREAEGTPNGNQGAAATEGPFQETHGYSPATYRRPEYLDYLEKATVAIRTVRLFVYAGMAAFIIVAFYVFFLIYQLTTDLHRAVEQTIVMTGHMQQMTEAMTDMRTSMMSMDRTMTTMDGTVRKMDGSVERMTSYINQMGNTVTLMQHSARNLDQSIGPVMGTMNRMVPFGWGGNNYGGAPPYAPPMR